MPLSPSLFPTLPIQSNKPVSRWVRRRRRGPCWDEKDDDSRLWRRNKKEGRRGGTQSNFLPSFSLSWAGLGLSSSSSSSFSLQRRGGRRNRKRAIRRLLRRRRGHTRRGPRGEIGRFSPRTVLRRRLACFLPPGGKQGEGGGGSECGEEEDGGKT